jgi:PKD repeat protein
LKGKILALLVGIALLVGVLSGCVEQEEEEPENTAPTAVISITQNALEITYDGTGSTDADEDDLTYSWTFGDDTGTSTDASGTYTYAASGDYTVTLAVNDGTIDSDPVTEDITVTNPPTVALAALPENITNTTEVTFTATATAGDAEINETTGYAWYIDDVVQENETTSTFVHTFEDGTYEVKVMVTDDDSLTGEATITITVPTEVEE